MTSYEEIWEIRARIAAGVKVDGDRARLAQLERERESRWDAPPAATGTADSFESDWTLRKYRESP